MPKVTFSEEGRTPEAPAREVNVVTVLRTPLSVVRDANQGTGEIRPLNLANHRLPKLSEPRKITTLEEYEEMIDKGIAANNKFLSVTGICLETKALKNPDIGSFDFGLVDYWRYDGLCLPHGNMHWKPEHLRPGKQKDVLNSALPHPILEEEEARHFCDIFQQGSFDNWKECYKVRFSRAGEGERWWSHCKDEGSGESSDMTPAPKRSKHR